MTAESILNFALAMLVLASSPGPGVFASVAQALASGFRSSLNVIAGIVLGDVLFLMFAVFGLSAVAHLLGDLFFIVKIIGGIYLIWLGYKTWTSKEPSLNPELSAEKKNGWQRFLGGLFITLSNPKVIVFYCGFLPNFMDLSKLSILDALTAATVVIIVLSGVMMVYAWFASRVRRFFKSSRAVKNMNRGAGTVLVFVGILLIFH